MVFDANQTRNPFDNVRSDLLDQFERPKGDVIVEMVIILRQICDEKTFIPGACWAKHRELLPS